MRIDDSGSNSFKIEKRFAIKTFMAAMAGVLYAAILVAALALVQIKNEIHEQLGSSLKTVLKTSKNDLRFWLDQIKNAVKDHVLIPELGPLVLSQLELPRKKEALLNSPHLARLDQIYQPVLEAHGFLGYIVIAPDFINIASYLKENIGDVNIMAEIPGLLSEVFRGKTMVSPPIPAEIPLPGKDTRSTDSTLTMFVVEPVRDKDGVIIAAIAFRLDPGEVFTQFLKFGRLGVTGETYAFNRKGLLITESRFNDMLTQAGSLRPGQKSTMSIEIRDPQGNLVKGYRPKLPRKDQPLTRMAAQAVRGIPGVDLVGYRDYRGIPVVGAWLWEPELQIGLATEMDKKEAYATYFRIRNLLFFVLTFILVTFSLFAFRLFQAGRQTVRASEKIRNLSQAVDQSFSGILITDVHGNIQFANTAICQITGYTQEEIAGQKPHIFNSGVHSKDFFSSLWTTILSGKVWKGKICNKTRNGTLFWEYKSITPIKNDNDEITHFLAVGMDFTKQKMIEEELKKSQERFNRAVEGSSDAFWEWDVPNDSIWWSSRFYEFLEYNDPTIASCSQAFEKLAHPWDRNLLRSAIKTHLKENKPLDIEIRLRTRSGNSLWFRLRGRTERDENGNAVSMAGSLQNIHKQKCAQNQLEKYQKQLELLVVKRTGKILEQKRALEKSEEQLRIITDNLPVLISYVDSGLTYRFNNKTYEKWFGRPLEEITGNKVENILGKKGFSIIKPHFNRVLSGEIVVYESRIPKTNGEVRYVQGHLIPHIASPGKPLGFFALVQDITEKKQAEDELRKARESLLHSEKLSALGKLVGSVAHEFNNPIYGVMNIIQQTQEIKGLTPKQSRLLKLGIKECQRMTGMIGKLQDFYRPSTGIESPLNLNEIVSDMFLLTEKNFSKKNIVIKTVLDKNLPIFCGVEDHVKQLLLNLIHNAGDAMEGRGGEIEITTEYRDSKIFLTVRDNGCGIPGEKLDSIFEPFFSSKGVKGTGLGLSVGYGIVKSHGGEISVKSEVGKGTVFEVTFPKKKILPEPSADSYCLL